MQGRGLAEHVWYGQARGDSNGRGGGRWEIGGTREVTGLHCWVAWEGWRLKVGVVWKEGRRR